MTTPIVGVAFVYILALFTIRKQLVARPTAACKPRGEVVTDLLASGFPSLAFVDVATACPLSLSVSLEAPPAGTPGNSVGPIKYVVRRYIRETICIYVTIIFCDATDAFCLWVAVRDICCQLPEALQSSRGSTGKEIPKGAPTAHRRPRLLHLGLSLALQSLLLLLVLLLQELLLLDLLL